MNDTPQGPPEFQTPGSAPPPEPEVLDDAGSRALSEALKSSFAVIKGLMIVLVLVFLGSGFFTVGTQERAVILRFGKVVGDGEEALLGPGPHWAFPYPIDEVVRIPVGQVQTVRSTVGWYASSATLEAAQAELPPGDSLNPASEGYLLTADGNIIHARGALRYRISEPGLRYVFDFVNGSNAVQNAFNNALIHAAAHYTVDNALTRDTAGFRERVRARLEQIIAAENLGVAVDQIDLPQVIPPRQLRQEFDAVLEAEVRSAQQLNEARTYANETVSKARSEAGARVNAGETARNLLVEFVAAEAQRFEDLLPAYQRNPELFVQQHRAEAMQRILTNAQMKILLPARRGGERVEVRLQLGREPEIPPLPGGQQDSEHGH